MFHATETFPFGDVSLSSVSVPALSGELLVQRVALTPSIPKAMDVDVVAGYRIEVQSPDPIHDFSFDIRLARCQEKGEVNSGECLDAQSWKMGDGLLMIGTEDGEALQNRMPWIDIRPRNYPIDYLADGFRLVLPYIAPKTVVGFHFVLSYNRVESENDSEWFAVDIAYKDVSESPVVKRLSGAIR